MSEGILFNKIVGGEYVDEYLPKNSSVYFQVQDCAAVHQPHLIDVIVKSVVKIDSAPEGFQIEGIIDRTGPTIKITAVYCPRSQSGWIIWTGT